MKTAASEAAVFTISRFWPNLPRWPPVAAPVTCHHQSGQACIVVQAVFGVDTRVGTIRHSMHVQPGPGMMVVQLLLSGGGGGGGGGASEYRAIPAAASRHSRTPSPVRAESSCTQRP